MSLPRLTYTLNGATYEVDQLTAGLDTMSLITELEADQLFYRIKWNGDITFTGDDFKRFYANAKTTCCEVIKVQLYRTGRPCADATPYWIGKFSLSDLEFNTDTCTAKLSTAPVPDDGYQTLLESWEKEFNWLLIDVLSPIYSADRKTLYRRGRLLTQVIAGMIRLTLTGTNVASLIPTVSADVISVFLESNLNPVTRRANTVKDLVCIQASDFVAPGKVDAANPDFAVRASLTLKELVEDMQALLRLFPYIDPATGKLRFEHESFFPGLSYGPPESGFSLPTTNPIWEGKRGFKTNTSGLYGEYRLTISPNKSLSPTVTEDNSPFVRPAILNNPFGLIDVPGPLVDDPTVPVDFTTGTITFTDFCVKRLPGQTPIKNEQIVNRFTTYIESARVKPESIEKAEWIFLVQPALSSNPVFLTPQISYGVVDTFGVNCENGNLSASSLVRDFHRHNKPFSEGYTNISAKYLPTGIRRGMLSVTTSRELDKVTVPRCCTDEPISMTKHIQTWYGSDAVLKKAEYKLAQDLLTLELVHPGPCQVQAATPFDENGNPSPCPQKGQPLRFEQTPIYPGGGNYGIPCRVIVDQYFTDGECGEYKVTTETSNGFC